MKRREFIQTTGIVGAAAIIPGIATAAKDKELFNGDGREFFRQLREDPNRHKWEAAYKAIEEKIGRAIDGKVFVRYSVEHDENGTPIDNLDEVAVTGKAIFIYHYAPEEEWVHAHQAYLENPTWLEVAVIANEAIKASSDHHHVFLEGIEQRDLLTNADPPKLEIKVMYLLFGS